ncbi:MAG: hypothetical protein KDC46_06690, partial [Thermoleophilia bacterium]|nr:hypothetical protein [Thermoleophilia bacterium]
GRVGVTGVRSGTALGAIDARAGWALVLHAPARGHQARGINAILVRGVPAGARRLGLIRTPRSIPARGLSGQDMDRDGIVNAFDVDDDGDLQLDNVDASVRGAARRGSSARSMPTPRERQVRIFSNLKLALEDSLNANAGSSAMSRSAVNDALTSAQTLAISVVPGDEVELDCGGLTYCSSGGTGTALEASSSGGTSFPDDFDSDGDGMGTITAGPTGDFQLLTGATFDRLDAGDTFIERVTAGSRTLAAPGMLAYAFTSTPAVTAWSDDAGASTTSVSYPVDASTPGTTSNPAEVEAGSDGHVVLTFTLWRPQRPRIAPVEARWVDIGGLGYSVDVPNAPGGTGSGPGICAGSSLSESDPSLVAAGDQLRDRAPDRAASASHTITFTVDMTDCLGTTSWDVGETLSFDLQARTRDGDNAAQKLTFVRTA